MVKVNLLSKRKGIRKQRNVVGLIGLGVFGLFTLFFLFQVVFVVYRYVSVNSKLEKVKQETEVLSSEILRDNERLNRFILSKLILKQIISLRSRQFDYSAYLDQAQLLVPAGSEIAGVDFQTTGFVNLRVRSSTSNDFDLFERSIKSADLSASDFESIIVGSVNRDKQGEYRTDVLIGIKKENGNK